MLALSPCGGSFVIFTPFCRMFTGNLGDGYDVIHRRKEGLVVSGLRSSQILSKLGIQLGARWQFYGQQRKECEGRESASSGDARRVLQPGFGSCAGDIEVGSAGVSGKPSSIHASTATSQQLPI
jgi:hypothetical protein